MTRLVAVTTCPTGVAHTYMAAEAIIEAAKEKDIWVKVETQGALEQRIFFLKMK